MWVDQSRGQASTAAPSRDDLRARYDQATAGLDPPLALVDLAAFDASAADLARRAAGPQADPGRDQVAALPLPDRAILHSGGQLTTVPTYRGEGQCFG
jgi:hypothetical protein